MFWNKKKKTSSAKLEAFPPGKAPLTDPVTEQPLHPMDTPGYYRGFSTLSQQKFWDAATRELIRNRLSQSGAIKFFSPEEARTMAAVCDRVVPQEDRTQPFRIDILAGIDKRLQEGRIEGYRYEDMPSDEEAYRLAARAFEEMARDFQGKPFHELATLDQEKLIKQIHDGQPKSAKALWKQMNVERFWTLLVTDCCSVYYAHPFAWDEIGFGGPAYPRGYMRLEEGEAEPWEMNERRYGWSAPSDTLSDS